MKGKRADIIRWEEHIIRRIEKKAPGSIVTPIGMDLHKYDYVKGEKRRGAQRWIRGDWSRETNNNRYHRNHPKATYYYKE